MAFGTAASMAREPEIIGADKIDLTHSFFHYLFIFQFLKN
jgi:hypothetical protein